MLTITTLGLVACGGGSSEMRAPAPDAGPVPEEVEVIAVVRGTLADSDLAAAQARHDEIARAGEEPSLAAGDFGHQVGLGTSLLGTTPNAFLAMDRWDSREAPPMFYGNPDFQAAFSTLFSGMPSLELFERQPDWHQWGDLRSGDGATPHYYAIVRGRLRGTDREASRVMHDRLAEGGEEAARGAGDVAHVVGLGLADPREFLAVDVWTSMDAIEAVYGNPDFQAGFAALFEGTPTIAIYGSTDWYQW
jgi:quinol monooxygenase YgiN